MSYSRHVSGNVPYSGTVSYSGSVSFPASESGGSRSYSGNVSYSGYVPVSINVNVITDPFDHSIANCRGALNGLSNSIVVMNGAQCEQIKESANNISGHVIGGFFSMIKSEISQNMQALFSKINSSLGLIMDRSKRIKEQQEIMNTDYNRSKKRYNAVFADLDEECCKRIIALDKKAFDLGRNIQTEQLTERQTECVGKSFLCMNDDSIAVQQLSIARLKKETSKVIEDLSTTVNQEMVYSVKMNSILTDIKTDKIIRSCVPVIFEQSDSFSGNDFSSSCYITPVLSDEIREKINEVVFESLGSLTKWNNLDEKHKELINTEFNKYIEGVEDIRVYNLIKQLKENTLMQVI